MKGKFSTLGLLLSASIILSGCSYKDFDDKVQGALQDSPQSIGGVDGYTPDGRPYAEISLLSEDQIEFKGIGESIPDYKSFTIIDDTVETPIERGVKGLTYTLEAVQTFSNFSDSNVDSYGCILDDKNMLETNSFILVDIKASYVAPSDGPNEIMADASDLSGMFLTSKLSTPVQEAQKPYVGYFSLRPERDDPRLDYQHQPFCYYIKDGTTINFQLGVFCEQEYIDAKNVFLEVNEVPQPNEGTHVTGDFTRKLFVLFPENEG